MSRNRGKKAETEHAAQLVAGIEKHFANVASLMFASATHATGDIVKALKALGTMRAAVEDAQSASKAAVAKETTDAPPIRALMADLDAFVKSQFSKSPDVLADFGLAPKKARTPTPAAKKTAAVAKREATRKARGTMGKKAKLAVKGDVVGVVVTPVHASASSSSAAGNGGSTSHGA
jgi:hypothetical protein